MYRSLFDNSLTHTDSYEWEKNASDVTPDCVCVVSTACALLFFGPFFAVVVVFIFRIETNPRQQAKKRRANKNNDEKTSDITKYTTYRTLYLLSIASFICSFSSFALLPWFDCIARRVCVCVFCVVVQKSRNQTREDIDILACAFP